MSWIETSNGNRISKEAEIFGSDRILLSGNTTINPGVKLDAEVPIVSEGEVSHVIQIGKFCYLGKGCKITPPLVGNDGSYGSIRIGSYSIIGENSKVLLASIGNRVLVEGNCKLGDLSIIYDCCLIREGCVVPPKFVIPPFSEVSGIPGKNFVVTTLSNSYRKLIESEAKERYLLG